MVLDACASVVMIKEKQKAMILVLLVFLCLTVFTIFIN